jgi:NADH-quinone oxidoreductase subunit A
MRITIIIVIIVVILYIVSYNYRSGFMIKERRYDSPRIEKYSKYECGEEPIEELNKVEELYIKYYMIALTYLLFDIEIILLFPYISYLLSINHLLLYSFSLLWSSFILIFFFFVLLGLFLEYLYGLFN